MKLAARVAIALLLLLAAAIALLAMRASMQRRSDEAYHAALARTRALHSASFYDGGALPAAFTCRGEERSPQLEWDGAPPGTASFAILADDWDVPSPALPLAHFNHWILFDIAGDRRRIDEAVAAADLRTSGIRSGTNSAGHADYAPPCPPMGVHRYIFRLYALDVAHLRPASDGRAALLDAMKGHVLGYGEIVATFGR